MQAMHTEATNLWNVFGPKATTAIADNAAIADPSQESSADKRIAGTLAIMLEYDLQVYGKELRKTAKWLLERVGGDEDGLLDVLEAKGEDVRWLQWVIQNDVNIYAVRKQLLDAYARRGVVEQKREFANTTAGRKSKYISEGVQW